MPSTRRVSVGQAAANALSRWLISQFPSDIRVFAHWPEAGVDLFAPRQPGSPTARAVVSIIKIGRRLREAEAFEIDATRRVNLSASKARITFQLGGLVQPMQLDVWARYEPDRDDVIARLDDALYAGIPETLNIPGDPIRDGILLALADGFEGAFADFWFDDADIGDAPTTVKVAEWRATYFGQARTAFATDADVVRLKHPTLNYRVHEAPQDDPNQPFVTVIAGDE